jgi:D-alanyl-D-alanine carboxypeptidase
METGHHHPCRSYRKVLNTQICALFWGVIALALSAFTPAARAIDASIVVDANSDTVISQENADRLLHPASMSKLMTLYLTFEALEAGRITMQRSFPVSAHAESMSPTKLGLVAGQSIRVEDAILSLVTLSANDAAVVLAEGLGGSEDRFGQLMTRKAHQLGMVNTNFRNSNGLPDPAQISTARDMAILCRALIRRFPQYYHYFSVREFTYNGVMYSNHNHLMSRYEGMDGLKTGLTNASGFNLAASAVRNGRRLIGVVFGGVSAAQRDDYMAEILDQGFQRAGGVAMTTAAPPPVPGRKPGDSAPAAPAPPQQAASLPPLPVPAAAPPEPEVAISNPEVRAPIPSVRLPTPSVRINAPRPTDIGTLTAKAGQGDVSGPGDSRRDTAAPRVAMATPARRPSAAAEPTKAKRTGDSGWSIQVGAYSTRQATEQAIHQAVQRAPDILKHATVVVAEMPNHRGVLYRARLTGLEAADARKACKLLSHCLTVPPGAS